MDPFVLAQIRITPVAEGWRVLVGDGVVRPVEGLVPRGPELDALLAARPVPHTSSRLILQGSDAAFARAEAEVATRFEAALSLSGPAWAQLQVLRGRADGVGVPLTVVIDAEAPEVRALPWELLSFGEGPHEALTGGLVARWVSGVLGRSTSGATAAVWVGAQDPESDALAAEIREALAAAGLREVELSERPTLLWIVAHGTRGTDQLEVALDGAPAGSTAAVSARLGDALQTARIAIVGVCHGAATELDRRDVLVGRLHHAGVELVVAPPHAVPAELVATFARGLTRAVAEGTNVAGAVSAGRRAVRAWAIPHPLARWISIPCFVSTTRVLGEVLCPPCWVPEGWPAPDASARAWLQAAYRDAERREEGYVGIEHLLRALATVDGGGPTAAEARRMSPAWLAACDAAVASLRPQHLSVGVPRPTPRLVRFGEQLQPGFSAEALADLLLDAFPIGVVEPGAETVEGPTVPGAGQPATALEVLGGPEDGRPIVPAPGAVIGRAGSDADIELYIDTYLTDRRLSRRHLRWEDAVLVAVHPIEVSGLDGPRSPEERLRVGDVVVVTPATRLRAIRRPES